MDDRIDFFRLEDMVEAGPVQDVALVEGRLLSGDFLNPADDLFARIRKIVEDDGIVAVLQKFHHRVAADETGPACHKYCHI